MDTWEKDLAACEQDVVMTDSWWPSTPPLLSVPIMSSNEGLGHWNSPSTVDPFFFGDVGTARNVPRDFVQSPTGDIGTPTPDFEAMFHHSDADIDLAFDWVDFEIPLHSVDGIVEPRSFIDNNMLSPASGALRSPGNPTTRIRRTALNQRQKGILAEWIARNSKPYPSREDKANLATATGLSVKQISGWFARTRQRALPRVQSHATVATQSGISSSATREKCTKNQSIGLLGDLKSYGRPILAGAALGLHWSRCTSLPPQPKRSFARTFPKRARSLPHIFTLDLIHPCTSNLSQLSQGRLSLDVAAPTHRSESNKLDCGAQPLTRRVVLDPIYPLKPISNFNFIEAWIQDVARYVAPSTDGPLEIKRFSPSVKSHDINNSQITEETRRIPTVFSQGAPTAGLQISTADNQVPLQAIQDTKHIARQRRSIACKYCRRRKIRCSGYSDSPEKRCKSCIKMKLECVFEPISVTQSTTFVPVLSPGNDAPPSDQIYAGNALNAAPQSSQNKNLFDTMSSAGSSAGSAGSASSYMSFGPRKGRRVAFRKPSLGDSNSHTVSPGFATSFQTPKDHSPANYDGCQIVSETTEYHDHDKPFSENENNDPMATEYWCTFCHQRFSRYFTWKRHEESAHAPQFTWICRPEISINKNLSECPLCLSSSPNVEYTSQLPCPHRFQECWQKPDLERTFYRPDTFMQHLYSVHFKADPIRSYKLHDRVSTDNCKQPFREMDADKLICHFCGFGCRTWNERAQHIREHFENGETMELWIPGGPYALNRDGSTPQPISRRTTPI